MPGLHDPDDTDFQKKIQEAAAKFEAKAAEAREKMTPDERAHVDSMNEMLELFNKAGQRELEANPEAVQRANALHALAMGLRKEP